MARKQTPTQQAHWLVSLLIEQFIDGGGISEWLGPRGFDEARMMKVEAHIKRMSDEHFAKSGNPDPRMPI